MLEASTVQALVVQRDQLREEVERLKMSLEAREDEQSRDTLGETKSGENSVVVVTSADCDGQKGK